MGEKEADIIKIKRQVKFKKNMYKLTLTLALICCSISAITCVENPRALVLLDNLAIKESHSIFFKTLTDLGFSLTYKTADDPSIVLKKYGSYLFDHLILFSPSVEEFGGDLKVEGVTEFIDAGGNVLVAGNSQTGDVLREIASECGFEADEEGNSVIDHLNFDVDLDDGKHTLIAADPANLIDSKPIVGDKKSLGPILYEGTGLMVDNENPLVLEILTASSTAYSHNPDEPVIEYPHATGKGTVLVAGLQARNNARVVFAGSIDMLSDKFFNAKVSSSSGKKATKSGNQALAVALASWCFQLSGVLRVKGVDHHLEGEKGPQTVAYTIKDDVVYSIDIEEYSNGKWVPYNGKDVQMEFVRIDPFVRLTLNNQNGHFEGKFKIPDVYGVYQFKVDYVRPGVSRLLSTTQFSVRPWRHDQYERFISSAYPYYASSFSMMFGVVLFSVVFLHHQEKPKTE